MLQRLNQQDPSQLDSSDVSKQSDPEVKFAVESDVVKELQERLQFANETVSTLLDQNSTLQKQTENSLEIALHDG